MRFPHILFVSVFLVTTIILASCGVFKPSGHEKIVPGDTAHYHFYYGEDGKLIKKFPGEISQTFVVKTEQTRTKSSPKKLLFTSKKDIDNTPADFVGIPEQLRERVITLIKSGDVKNDTVINNTVLIVNREILCNIRKVIKDNTKGDTDSINNKEYGGNIFENDSFSIIIGPISNPRNGGAHVAFNHDGKGDYHSHPSGYIKIRSGVTGGTGSQTTTSVIEDSSYYFMQEPSMTDQIEIGSNGHKQPDTTRISYVFAMRTGVIYIYNYRGVLATLPLKFAR